MDDVSDIITVFFWHCDWENRQQIPWPRVLLESTVA
jgi:hypothetical protein